MVKIIIGVLLVTVSLAQVHAYCKNSVIEKIKELWDGNPPVDNLPKLVGAFTYLYLPPYMINNTDGLKCMQTMLESDEVTTWDFTYFDNATLSWNQTYNMVEEQRGVITMTVGDGYDDYLYVLYIKHGVFSFYQCREKEAPDEGFFNIGVVDYNKRKHISEVKAAIAVAKERLDELKGLGIKLLSKLRTDCPEHKVQ